ncbi:microtubule-binding stalk of dynein motor domain-containing protein [Ditylenchus destructor]|uniref:Microtubule-binding stalk of dynein motor domain-containing protein n=1 Tax=Ditylenchus destructor TaxID=166010 RepID=A0AAD4N969_9BILA|nr:microtubule-binding stalk of dynein motor domain-containing protein [Ditylenchus destructor]
MKNYNTKTSNDLVVPKLPTLRRTEFRPRFTNEKFIFHLLEGVEDPQALLKSWEKQSQRLKAANNLNCVTRSQFTVWHQQEHEKRKQAKQILRQSLNEDIAYARAWFWITRQKLAEEDERGLLWPARQFPEESIEREIVEECLEWFWGASRLALLQHYFGQYGQREAEQVGKIHKSWASGERPFVRDGNGLLPERPTTAMAFSNLTRFRIRRYIEERKGVIFDNSWMMVAPDTTTTPQMRLHIFAQLKEFHATMELKLVPNLPHGRKMASLNITLNQECTKAAHATVTRYLEVLENEIGRISVQCQAAERKLQLPVDKIRDDLKSPIVEISKQERIRFTLDEVESYVEQCIQIVDKRLAIEEIQRGPFLAPFSRLIYNEQVAFKTTEKYLAERLKSARQSLLKLSKCPESLECGIFCVKFEGVWETLRERAHTVILRCSQLIRENFHNHLVDLDQEFHRFKRVLNFRSTDPATMLTNKAEAITLCEKDIPRAVETLMAVYDRMYTLTQLLQFDPSEHEHLIGLVAMRRALPRQISDHSMFFQRRLHVFSQFVRERQSLIRSAADEAINRLKIINTFTNPMDTEEYLREMIVLKPLALSLLENVTILNEQEQAVRFSLTKLPQIESLAKYVDKLWSLFEWTKKYQNYQSEFYNRSRIDARVSECQAFLNNFVDVLTQLSSQLEGQKAARHFIVQVRNDVEKFRMELPVLEIMSSSRLRDRHWEKISEVVGIDLSQYVNATIAQFCELDLKQHISKLKPIAFSAEREGEISDQANFIADYWNDASFEMEASPFWNVQIPTNLKCFIGSAKLHRQQLKQFRDSETEKSLFTNRLDKWIHDLEAVHLLLEQWHSTLRRWKRISDIMKYSHETMTAEFEHFRMCAKYWKRMARFIDEERLVIKLLEMKHIPCWLKLVDQHLLKLIQGVKDHLLNLRNASARMCLLSDSDLLKLLSGTVIDKRLAILRRECFPYFSEFFLNAHSQLCGINLDGETVAFQARSISLAVLEKEGPAEFVERMEQTIHDIILQDYAKHAENRDTQLLTYKVSKQLDDFIHRSQALGSHCKHVRDQSEETLNIMLEFKGSQHRLELRPLDFVLHMTALPSMDANFATSWSSGKVPLIFGTMHHCRWKVRTISSIIFAPIHFVNCHHFLKEDAAQQNSVLMILENLDQLVESERNALLERLESVNRECIRLVFCTTMVDLVKSISKNPAVFLTDPLPKTANIVPPPEERVVLNVNIAETTIAESTSSSRRVSRVSSVSGRRPSTAKNKSMADALLETMIGGEIAGLNSIPGFCVACVGPSARETLAEALECGASVTWIYFDAFTNRQLMSHNEEFGKISNGFLLNNLKETMKRDEGSSRSRISSMAGIGEDRSSPGHERTNPGKETQTSSIPARFMVLYGLHQFRSHFSFISPLFRPLSSATQSAAPTTTAGHHATQQSGTKEIASQENVSPLPGSYITLPDGSNFYAADNITFILCIPSKSAKVLDWLARYNIRTIIIDNPANASENISETESRVVSLQQLGSAWSTTRHHLQQSLKKVEYIDIIANVVEHVVIPAFDRLTFHPACAPRPMFETMQQDLAAIVSTVTPANCGEVLRYSVSSTCINFLAIYSLEPTEKMDRVVTDLFMDADKHALEASKIPPNITQWKLSTKEIGHWVCWKDERSIPSSVERELSLTDIFVTYPEMDRILLFSMRRLRFSEDNLLVVGPRFSGKSAAIRKLVRMLQMKPSPQDRTVTPPQAHTQKPTVNDEFHFVWLDSAKRFDLESAQQKLLGIIKESTNARTLVFVVDNFHFQESITSLLEMYLDQNLIIQDGTPIESFRKIKVILITENVQYNLCRKYGVFGKKFCGIFIRPPNQENIINIMEQVIEWHLTTKTFSSEYRNLVTPIANASIKMMKVCQKDMERILPLILRLCKGIMFSFPDNTPDLDSMLRLWCHELIRVLMDGEWKSDIRAAFLSEFGQVIHEELKSNVEKLFPSKANIADDEEDIDDQSELNSKADGIGGGSSRAPEFSLHQLLYSEMAGFESMEGLPYNMVGNRHEFCRALENLHFEYARNNENSRINLVVTGYIADHCQHIMRVNRQHSEHLVLVARPGSGRHQCVKLATFGLIGQTFRVFFDTEDAMAFEASWKRVMRRVVLSLATQNQIINVFLHMDYILDNISAEWLIMFKQWIQHPIIEELLSDDEVLKTGESIVECEKTLATMLQSSNIRLPGQRCCQFLQYEATKNLELLKNLLSARVTDFVTFVFLVPPQAITQPSNNGHQFDWCSVEYFLELSDDEIAHMKDKILGECVYEYRSRLLDTLNQIFATVQSSHVEKKGTVGIVNQILGEQRPETKLLHDFFQAVVTAYNTKHSGLEKKLTTLKHTLKASAKIRDSNFGDRNYTASELATRLDDEDLILLLLKRNLNETSITQELLATKIDQHQQECAKIVEKLSKHKDKIGIVMQEPEEELHKITTKLAHYKPLDFRKLAAMKSPSMAVRYAVEAIRMLIDDDFVLKPTAQDNWEQCQARLQQHGLYNQLLTFNPLSVNPAKLKAMKRYTDNREFKPLKMRVDSELAADLCQWALAVVNVSNVNKVLRNHRRALNECTTSLTQTQTELQSFREEELKCGQRISALDSEIKEMEEELLKIRRTMDYRQRSDKVLSALSQHNSRWKAMIKSTKTTFNNLLGNSIFEAGFRVLLAPQPNDTKMVLIAKWKSLLMKSGVNYEERASWMNLLANNLISETNCHSPWPIILEPKRTVDVITYLERLFPSNSNIISVDMSEVSGIPQNGSVWMSEELIDKVHRASHSEGTLIIHNIKDSPPSAWYELLGRELNKDNQTVIFDEGPLRIGPKFRLIFVSTFEALTAGKLDMQFLRMLQPIIVEGKMDAKEGAPVMSHTVDESAMSADEETLLKILSEYTAVDILESQELADQVVRICNSLAIEKSKTDAAETSSLGGIELGSWLA